MMIYSDTLRHVMGDDAYADIAYITSLNLEARYGREIQDGTALTIASWWQSPGRVGHVLAQLASSRECDLDALVDDIDATLRNESMDERDREALDCLMSWAYAKAGQ